MAAAASAGIGLVAGAAGGAFVVGILVACGATALMRRGKAAAPVAAAPGATAPASPGGATAAGIGASNPMHSGSGSGGNDKSLAAIAAASGYSAASARKLVVSMPSTSRMGGPAKAAGLPPLLDGWVEVWSNSRSAHYWRHEESGETTWERPSKNVPAESPSAAAAPAPAAGASAGATAAATGALPPGWTEKFSNSRQVAYWTHDDGRTVRRRAEYRRARARALSPSRRAPSRPSSASSPLLNPPQSWERPAPEAGRSAPAAKAEEAPAAKAAEAPAAKAEEAPAAKAEAPAAAPQTPAAKGDAETKDAAGGAGAGAPGGYSDARGNAG